MRFGITLYQPDFLPSRNCIAGFLAIAVFTLIAYYPITKAGYIWDDAEYVTGNPPVLETGGISQIWLEPGATPYYYPTTFSIFWLGHQLWGLHPLGFHLLNLAFHILNACLLVIVLTQLKVPGSILAGLIFALHPVQSASVAWVTELKNVLSETLYLGALFFWLRGSDRFGWSYWVAVFVFLLAMLAKPVVCSFPVILLLIVWWKSDVDWRRQVLTTLPFFLVSVGISLFTLVWEGMHKIAIDKVYDLGLFERGFLCTRSFAFYVSKLVWPNPLVAVYPHWDVHPFSFQAFMVPLGILSVFLFLWFMRSRWGRGPLAAALALMVTLGPILGIVNFSGMVYSFVYTHHLYHATSFFAAMVGFMLGSFVVLNPSGIVRVILWGFTCGLLIAYGIQTWKQTEVSQSERTLFEHNVKVYPDIPQPRIFLGNALLQEGETDLAMAQFTEALALSPTDPQAHFAMAGVMTRTGEPDRAFEHLKKAVEAGPTFAAARFNLAWAYLNRGDHRRAIEHFEEILRARPQYWSAYVPLAETLSKEGRGEEAMETLKAVLVLRPEYAEARFRLAILTLQQGDLEGAVSHFKDALQSDPDQGFQLKPKFAEALVGQARTFRETHEIEKADQFLSEAERIWPRLSSLQAERAVLDRVRSR